VLGKDVRTPGVTGGVELVTLPVELAGRQYTCVRLYSSID